MDDDEAVQWAKQTLAKLMTIPQARLELLAQHEGLFAETIERAVIAAPEDRPGSGSSASPVR